MILVTGGTGLLGSHLLFNLTEESGNLPIRAIYRQEDRLPQVKALFNFYDKVNGNERFSRIHWVKADILDIPSLEEAFPGVQFVYHCAALVSFSKKDFAQLMKINREGTANIVNVALDHGVKKLCYVSSTAAIGGQSNTITTEETKWKITPRTSGYAISKYSAEKEVWRGVEEGLDCIIVNPSVLFGAGNWNESSLTIFRTVEKGLKFYTPGQNGFVDARDVAEIMITLMNSETKNERFLCVSANVPFKILMEKIADQLHTKKPYIPTPRWLVGAIWRLSWLTSTFSGKAAAITRESANSAFSIMEYDSSKVKKLLNFRFRSIDETIQTTIQGRLDRTK